MFDIGKTTKKALVFDRFFNVAEENTEHFGEISDDEGFPSENLALVVAWMQEIVQKFLTHPRYEVTHLNFSAYGASLVSIDAAGEPLMPFYNYLKPCPDSVMNQFHDAYVANKPLLQQTASPWLGFLNSGMQAYWLRKCRPKRMAQTKWLLHLPQFFSFMMTGLAFSERTSLGCHTLLWDFDCQDYADWVKREGLHSYLPELRPTTFKQGLLLNDRLVTTGVGVHDSSSALMPYLVTREKPFLMLSTGTWNICFNAWNTTPLTADELQHDCLAYLTWEGKPVKASRIFLGHEHELQQRRLARHFSIDDQAYKKITFNERVYLQLKADQTKKFHPIGMEGTGPRPDAVTAETDYSVFTSFEEAQHQLMIDLVSWQKISIDLTDPDHAVRDVVVVGGFSKSPLFIETLKKEIPEKRFFLSEHPRASALGAAWLVHDPVSIQASGQILSITPA